MEVREHETTIINAWQSYAVKGDSVQFNLHQ
jgi:hypothetical protein